MFTKSPTGLIVIRLFSTTKDKYYLMSADVYFSVWLCATLRNTYGSISLAFAGFASFPIWSPLIMWPAKAEKGYFFRMKMIDIAWTLHYIYSYVCITKLCYYGEFPYLNARVSRTFPWTSQPARHRKSVAGLMLLLLKWLILYDITYICISPCI